jgi:hypothetical protein
MRTAEIITAGKPTCGLHQPRSAIPGTGPGVQADCCGRSGIFGSGFGTGGLACPDGGR